MAERGFLYVQRDCPSPLGLGAALSHGLFPILLGHREAELADDLPQGEVFSVGEGGQPRAVQAELALLVQQGLIHVHTDYLGQKQVVGSLGKDVQYLALQGEGALRDDGAGDLYRRLLVESCFGKLVHLGAGVDAAKVALPHEGGRGQVDDELPPLLDDAVGVAGGAHGYGHAGRVGVDDARPGHGDDIGLLHVSAGHHEIDYASMRTHPTMFLEDGCNAYLAAEIKKHVKTPVATVGAFTDPAHMEEIIASGKADIVEMARGLICEPDMPVKLRTGREKEVRKCLRCFRCVQEMYQHGRLFCVINPASGKDREIMSHHSVGVKKHVLVAGGGIAGMEAAITAAENGHKVTLCEKTDKLGGVLLCEIKVPFKTPIGEYIERQKYMLEKLGVDVKLNTAVTPEVVTEINPDALIVAIGGEPIRPNIPGIDGANVIGIEESFAKPELNKGKVVIIGAGRSGTELGIYLKENCGKEVSLIEAQEKGDQAKYLDKMAQIGLETAYNTKAKEIKENGIVCDTPEGEKFIEADTVVLALGVKPLWNEVDALSSFAGEFYQAGDCRAARSMLEASGEGWTMANLIGRF